MARQLTVTLKCDHSLAAANMHATQRTYKHTQVCIRRMTQPLVLRATLTRRHGNTYMRYSRAQLLASRSVAFGAMTPTLVEQMDNALAIL